MDPSQASAPSTQARVVAVRAAGAAAVARIDRIWDDGDAALPLDPALGTAAAHRAATALGAHVLIDDDGRHALARGVGVPSGTALVVRTSGTTGRPRGVVLSHTALDAAVAASVERLDARDARWVGVLPLQHVAGLLVVLRARAAGAPAQVHDRFDVAAVAAARDATHIALVPTMLHRLLEHGVEVGRFTGILLGGAAPPVGLLERAADAGARITLSYGMTETAGGCVYDGRPLDGVAVAVDPDDRILMRGPVLADGYRTGGTLTPLTDGDGWYRTPDVGRFAHGRLVVTGRADDLVVTGGLNVSTMAVSRLLREHPKVRDAAVVGVPDAEWGHIVVACVVPATPGDPPTLTALRAHVRDRGEAAMAPRRLVVIPTLPRTGLGKIDRSALLAMAADDEPSPARP